MANKTMAVKMYDLEGNFIQDFASITEAADEIKVSKSTLSFALKGGAATVDSFQFRYLDENTLDHLPEAYNFGTNHSKVPVAKYWRGRLIAVYNSHSEAILKNGLKQGEFVNALTGSYNIHGFTFKEIK